MHRRPLRRWGETIRGKGHQLVAAGLLITLLTALSVWGRTWPFTSMPSPVERIVSPSIWQYLLSDRLTLGFVRVAVVLGSLFLIASVAAHSVSARWMSGFRGLAVDEKESVDNAFKLEGRLKATQAQLDEQRAERKKLEDLTDTLLDELNRRR